MQPKQTRPSPHMPQGASQKNHTLPMTSITYAIMAQNALRAFGIRSNITRDERYYNKKSCGYALTVPPGTDMDRVRAVLRERHIKFAQGEDV